MMLTTRLRAMARWPPGIHALQKLPTKHPRSWRNSPTNIRAMKRRRIAEPSDSAAGKASLTWASHSRLAKTPAALQASVDSAVSLTPSFHSKPASAGDAQHPAPWAQAFSRCADLQLFRKKRSSKPSRSPKVPRSASVLLAHRCHQTRQAQCYSRVRAGRSLTSAEDAFRAT